MRLLKHMYIMMTVVIASIFLSMYITGIVMYKENWWYCLIPAIMVISDTIRNTATDLIRERRSVPARVTQPFNMVTWGVEFDKEFIKEEEFKV